MNSERRHELQQNYLADLLGTQLRKIENYTKLIAVVIVAVVVAAVAWGLYRSAEVGARSDATLELLQNVGSGDPEGLGQVGERYPGTPAGALAKLYQADVLLANGIAAQFNDREEAQTQLTDALKRYSEVAAASTDTLVRSRANFGIARTQESLGQVDKAIEAYKTVVSIGESEAMIKAAQHRIEALQKPETQEFLAWFERQDFRPADPALPPSMPSGGSLPDIPDLDLPEVSPLNIPAELRGEASEGPAPGELNLPQGAVEPQEEAAPAAAAEQAPAAEPAMEAEPAAPAPAPEQPAAEPATEQPAVEPEAAPATDPAPQPEPAAEPAPQPAPEPAPQPAPEPAPEPTPAPTPEPAPEPTPGPTPELTAEPVSEGEPAEEPATEDQPSDEPVAEPEASL